MPAVFAPVDSSLRTLLLPRFDDFVADVYAACDGPGGMGEMEVGFARSAMEMQRLGLEKAAQARADGTDRNRCPKCGDRLERVSGGYKRTVRTRFGEITLTRSKGYCARCREWKHPADDMLGLDKHAAASPGVQEASALMVSKMPATEAAKVIERLMGRPCDDSTMAREARRAGERAADLRTEMDEKACSSDGRWEITRALEPELGNTPFTLVIEMDAWLIRERDGWGGQTESSRWHWVYTGTMFRLGDRVSTQSGRPMILSRGHVATRAGLEEFSRQTYAEAIRQGMLLAGNVLIIADGGVWIWKIADDRFSGARCRLDFYHASQHLWTLANERFGTGTPEAKAWVEPLLHQLRHGEQVRVVETLNDLARTIEQPMRGAAQREANYFETHKDHLDYSRGAQAGEPIGSGAIESTCRQYQCRFKRAGQFWSIKGDEALLALETFWRNDRWSTLFPHARAQLASRN